MSVDKRSVPHVGSVIIVMLFLSRRHALAQCDLYEDAKLTASDAAPGDIFGTSVSVSGDTVVIGAANDDNAGGSNAGAAYVFVRIGAVWTQQQRLAAQDAATNDYFGYSVSVSDDIALVSAEGDDNAGGADAGSAYIFVRSGAVWTQQQKLTASDAASGDNFGNSVHLSEDTAVVGAYATDNAGTNSGSAYVFIRSGAVWTQQQMLTASDAAAGDWFGASVSVSGDTAVVGARLHDSAAGANAGAAYVYIRSGTVWIQQQKLAASDAAMDDQFGSSVSVIGDTVVVGAWHDDNAGGSDAGSAYVFVRTGTVWTQQQKLTASNAAANDWFGNSVFVSGSTAVVGAYHHDGAGSNSGSAYVFVRAGTVWTQQQKLNASDAAAGNDFGTFVSMSEDTVVVGAEANDNSGSGSAYVFDLPTVDCNANDISDACDIASGTSADCNANSIPDECDIANCPPEDPSCQDCNVDGVPDECLLPCGDGQCTLACAENPCTCPVDCSSQACSTDAECDDLDACTCDFCVCNACLHQPRAYGDTDCNCLATTDVDDILCVLDCFISDGAICRTADIAPPCTGDGHCDVDDILAVLDAFSGINNCVTCGTFCPLGACCNGVDCRVTTAAQCLLAGDAYKGDGTACPPLAPNPCP